MRLKEVFEQFLLEQQLELAPKTYRDYASVIELFEHQLARIIHKKAQTSCKSLIEWCV
jgi:hypothetical protein